MTQTTAELSKPAANGSGGKPSTAAVTKALIQGDLSQLTEGERLAYYHSVCESVGLNPFTKPFAFMKLNNQLQLYAKRDCAEQLRRRDSITITILKRELIGDVYVVTARATTPDGRADEDDGAVAVGNLKGEFLANAMLKAITKSKRRVTLSICGLGFLDESEVESIPSARTVPALLEKEQQPEPSQADVVYASNEQHGRIVGLLKEVKQTLKSFRERVHKMYGLDDPHHLSPEQADEQIAWLESLLPTGDAQE